MDTSIVSKLQEVRVSKEEEGYFLIRSTKNQMEIILQSKSS